MDGEALPPSATQQLEALHQLLREHLGADEQVMTGLLAELRELRTGYMTVSARLTGHLAAYESDQAAWRQRWVDRETLDVERRQRPPTPPAAPSHGLNGMTRPVVAVATGASLAAALLLQVLQVLFPALQKALGGP